MRRATWIFWLMLALLPLRGWAVASMDLPKSAAPGVEAVLQGAETVSSPAPSAAMPACHPVAAEDGVASTDGSCPSCDWCHAALALPASPGTVPARLPSGSPALTAARDTGRAADGGLERPPRPDRV